MDFASVVLIIVVGYLIGSFPTAYLVARTKGVDIFSVGSGNMGATNVTRALGWRYGLLVWAWDGLKGVLVVLLARAIFPEARTAASVIGAVAVVAGHNWSFLATLLTGSIRGGKGAATAMGTFLLLAPTFIVALTLGLAALVVVLTRFVSLAVLTASAVGALGILILVVVGYLDPVYTVYLLVSFMIFWRHRRNIYSLIQGTERRLGEHV